MDGIGDVEFASLLKEEISNRLKSNDYSIIVGAGIDFYKFHADARYDIGMKEVIEKLANKEIKLKNKAMSLMLGYSF